MGLVVGRVSCLLSVILTAQIKIETNVLHPNSANVGADLGDELNLMYELLLHNDVNEHSSRQSEQFVLVFL